MLASRVALGLSVVVLVVGYAAASNAWTSSDQQRHKNRDSQ